MKHKKALGLYIFISITALTLSSCFNIFSLFMPTEPDAMDEKIENIENVDKLMAMGNQALNNLEYDTAFLAFSKVVTLEPTNSLAIEGMCTAYLYSNIPLTNVVLAIIQGDYGIMNFNELYGVGEFIGTNLYKILNEEADGVIPNDDVNINLNFFVFNSMYAAFLIADTDGDRQVLLDTNDYFIISNDFSFSNRLPEVTNIIEVLQLINLMQGRIPQFVMLIERSEQSLDLLSNSMVSASGQNLISNVRAPILEMKTIVTSNFSSMSNLTAIDQFGLTNPDDITNILAENGYTNYDDLTNDLFAAGITNLSDPEAEITNILPDLTNFNELLTNYFGL